MYADDVDRDVDAIRLDAWGKVVSSAGVVPWIVVGADGRPVEPIVLPAVRDRERRATTQTNDLVGSEKYKTRYRPTWRRADVRRTVLGRAGWARLVGEHVDCVEELGETLGVILDEASGLVEGALAPQDLIHHAGPLPESGWVETEPGTDLAVRHGLQGPGGLLGPVQRQGEGVFEVGELLGVAWAKAAYGSLVWFSCVPRGVRSVRRVRGREQRSVVG